MFPPDDDNDPDTLIGFWIALAISLAFWVVVITAWVAFLRIR